MTIRRLVQRWVMHFLCPTIPQSSQRKVRTWSRKERLLVEAERIKEVLQSRLSVRVGVLQPDVDEAEHIGVGFEISVLRAVLGRRVRIRPNTRKRVKRPSRARRDPERRIVCGGDRVLRIDQLVHQVRWAVVAGCRAPSQLRWAR